MGFFSQLSLLCWKNYVVNKRNKIRLLTEICLPIILFLVLMFLRRIGDKKILPDCYFKPKAMPSAGDLAFYQSFYCSLNNTCDDSVVNASLHAYDPSVISTIMFALEEAFDLNKEKTDNISKSTESPQEFNGSARFENYFKSLQSIIANDKDLSQTELGDIVKSLQLSGGRRYSCGFFPPRRTREATWVEEPPGTDIRFINETIDPSENEPPDFLLEDLEDSSVLKALDTIFCGPNVPSLYHQLMSLSGQTEKSSLERKKEELESQSLSTSSDKMQFKEPEYENDTSQFCNDIMRSMEKSLATRVIWRMFKPLVRGKIVYTPDAPIIRKIMGNIHDTFARPRDLLRQVVQSTALPGMRELELIRNNDQVLKNIVQTELGAEILNFYGVKSDGDSEKSVQQDIKAFRKIVDNIIDAYNQQIATRRSSSAFNVADIDKYLECIDWSRTIPISNTKDALDEAFYWAETERLWALVEFVNISSNATELPPSITYKIRTGIERTHATFQIRDRVYRPRVRRDPFIDLKHITGGWAYIQNLVESELIKEMTGRKTVPGIYLQQTPYPCHIKDMFRESITRTLPMFMIVSWIFIFSMLIKKIVWEKERKVTQTLRVMGIGKAPHWVAWFLDAFVPMFLISVLLAVILVFGKIVSFSSFAVVWLFLVVYILPTISLAFLVSTCFTRASIAAAVSGLLFLVIYLPYPPISQFEERLDPNIKICLCLVSNIAFGLGCTWLANMEELGIGGHLSNMHVSPVPGNPINMYLIMGIMLLDAVVYFLIALYIENVHPGGDGVGRPYYFPFTKSYWFGLDNEDDINKDFTQPSAFTDFDHEKFETEPEGLLQGVSVVNLTKKFGKKMAVNNLNINFYEDQITSFLGHNGAGKSTSISIMTGLLSPTSGSVRLYGQNLNDCEIRNRDIGICSQENVLLEDLTVEEHLYFYARVKGTDKEKAVQDSYIMMNDVMMLEKRNTITKKLSGGMQRKVCVAIAFIGGSRVVFLDEPTAGVDPSSRRAIWDLLIKYKKGRTVVLTTHFMDEADLLGDRIAIIARGQVVCCGSPVFLKAKLGSGYYLTLDSAVRAKTMSRSVDGKDKEQSQIVKDLSKTINAIIPDATFLEQIASEISFVIPLQNSVDVYNRLFAALDDQIKLKLIKNYGISDTSLEEIFLKIAEESEKNAAGTDNGGEDDICSCFQWKRHSAYNSVNSTEPMHMNGNATNSALNLNSDDQERIKLGIFRRYWVQFLALLYKRALHHFRNYSALVVEIVMPAIFIIVALYLSSLLPSIQEMPPLEVDVTAYGPSYIFYSLDIPESARLRSYEKQLLGQTGLGTKCVRRPEKCSKKEIFLGSMVAPSGTEDTTPCPCHQGRYSCVAPPPSPPWIQTSSGDRLYNLTGQNITNWIVKTELAESYIRYGGLTLGYRRLFNSISLLNLFKIFRVQQFIPLVQSAMPSGNSTGSAGSAGNVPIDPQRLVALLMMSCSKSAGEQLLKNADPDDNILIWYNNRGWISGIAYMNAVSNLVLRASLPPGKDKSKYSIRLINHPLPVTSRQFSDELEKRSNVSLLRAMAVIWALAFIPATYAVYLISERASGFKHLQLISGVGRGVYWLSTFIWDFVCFIITILIVVLIFVCFNEQSFIGPDSIGAFLLLLVSYAAVSTTFVYPISFFFMVPSSGFVAISMSNIFIGMVTLLTSFVLSLITDKENPYYLETIFLIFPQFCLGKALLNISVKGIRKQSLATLGVINHPTYLTWDVSLKFVTMMLILTVIFFGLTLIIEYRTHLWRKKKDYVPEEYEDADEDVKKERVRVKTGLAKSDGDVLLLDNISKIYRGESRPAVDQLCLGVKAGECFGLLGLNGAGKTTCFKMLTGSLQPSSGDANIMGESIREDGQGMPLGYCPQSNALDPYLTPSEHLSFFGRLKGLSGPSLIDNVSKNIDRLGLDIHRDKMASSLSGGNKRKLNTAIALVGDPRVVLLDEPTSGMDPRARRFLWQVIHTLVQEGRCVILTSHSMEECQSLCTRLCIMVNGRFRCLGTCQHLKNKFDEGYSVVVRCLSTSTLLEVKSHLSAELPMLGEFETNYLQIKLRLQPGASLGKVFLALDDAKKKNLIRDYSISQTTLEQIFIKFAESQSQPTDDVITEMPRSFPFCCSRQKLLDSPTSQVPADLLEPVRSPSPSVNIRLPPEQPNTSAVVNQKSEQPAAYNRKSNLQPLRVTIKENPNM